MRGPPSTPDPDLSAPRAAVRLLSAALPGDRIEDVLGDLEEVHRRRIRRIGTTAAAALTSVAALWIAAAFLFIRYRDEDLEMPLLSRLDLMLALRLLRKQPLLSATVVVSLAVGIAVAAAGFTMIDEMLHGELPVTGGERYVRFDVRGAEGEPAAFRAAHYRAFAGQADRFVHIGALEVGERNVLHPSAKIETLLVAAVTPDSLAWVPSQPLLGRQLVPSDAQPGAAPVATLRESLWRRSYDADPNALGQLVSIGGAQHEIVGVLPDSAVFPAGGEIWRPLTVPPSDDLAPLSLYGILAPGTTLEGARSQVTTLSRPIDAASASELDETAAAGATGLRIEVIPYTQVPGPLGVMSLVGLLVPILVVLVIAANVANLVRARTAARAGELSVRTALGAPRARLIGQLTLEAAVLGVIAGALGVAAAAAILRWVDAAITEAPFWVDLTATPRTYAYTVLLAMVITAVCGLLPALRATRRDVRSQLATRNGSQVTRFGAAMMVSQMALAVALLSGALVMARGLWSAAGQELELPDQRVLTAQIVTPAATSQDSSNSKPLPQRVAEAARRIPGVLAAGTADHLPRYDAPAASIEIDGRSSQASSTSGARLATSALVSEGFLESLEASALSGRLLQSGDYLAGAPPVAVVNQPFVARFFGGVNPVGQRFRVVDPDAGGQPAPWREIVGVVPDLGLGGGAAEYAAGYYTPGFTGRRYFYASLLTDAEPESLGPALRTAMLDLNPDLVVVRMQRLAEVNAEERAFQAGFGAVLTALGGLALALSIVGLYAMISLSITQRTREIGVRLALGASARRVMQSVVRRAALNLVLGGLFGAALGLAFVRLQDQMLAARLPAGEPWILPTVLLAFTVAGGVASLLPAAKALRISPIDALRIE